MEEFKNSAKGGESTHPRVIVFYRLLFHENLTTVCVNKIKTIISCCLYLIVNLLTQKFVNRRLYFKMRLINRCFVAPWEHCLHHS